MNTTNEMIGLGKTERERLAIVLRGTKGTITVNEAAKALNKPSGDAAKLLALWTKKGWLSRVRRGLYVPVPLESNTADVVLEDSWVIAEELFKPCYIGGWSAAEYWDLTEQIFRTVLVMTTSRPQRSEQRIKGTDFLLKLMPEKAMFGLKTIWRGQTKVLVSDPTRTVLDMLNDPQSGGGLRSMTDMFCNYLASDKKDLALLIKYAKQLGNGAVFKRLGFLLEKFDAADQEIITLCREQMTRGNAKLDTTLPTKNLVSRWRLWVPEAWSKEKLSDQ